MKQNLLSSFLIFLFLGLSLNSFEQKLTAADLINLFSKKDFNSAYEYFDSKGWEYSENTTYESLHRNNRIWTYGKNYYEETAEGWIYLKYESDVLGRVFFEVFDETIFEKFKSSLKSSGFIFDKFVELETSQYSIYQNPLFILKLSSESEIKNNYQIIRRYSITITKKNGAFDDENGLKYEYDEYGNLQVKYTVSKGALNGECINYYPNGKTENNVTWRNGEKNGKGSFYDEEGVLTTEEWYKNGLLDGNCKNYENGSLISELTFKNDILNGPYKYYYPNKKLNETGTYVNAEKNGLITVYDELGVVIFKINYLNGKQDGSYYSYEFDELEKDFCKIYSNYSNDKLNGKYLQINSKNDTVFYCNYLNDEQNGNCTYFIQGSPIYNLNFKKDKRHGKCVYYVPFGEFKGKIQSEQNYNEGTLHGESVKYYLPNYSEEFEDSIISFQPVRIISNYKFGELNGTFTSYYQGRVTRKGNYIHDMKEGEWMETELGVFRDGEEIIVLNGQYVKDKKEGLWKGFINDSLYVTSNYLNGLLNGDLSFYNSDGERSRAKIYLNDSIVEFWNYYNDTIFDKIILKQQNSKGSYFEYIEENSSYNQVTHFLLPAEILINNETFFDNFISETKVREVFVPMDYKFKDGDFSYSSEDIIVSGQYSNNQKNGKWVIHDLEQHVYKELTYNYDEIIQEIYYDENKNLYTGNYSTYENFLLVNLTIKNGLIHGTKMTMNPETNEIISKEKYKKGVLKN